MVKEITDLFAGEGPTNSQVASVVSQITEPEQMRVFFREYTHFMDKNGDAIVQQVGAERVAGFNVAYLANGAGNYAAWKAAIPELPGPDEGYSAAAEIAFPAAGSQVN